MKCRPAWPGAVACGCGVPSLPGRSQAGGGGGPRSAVSGAAEVTAMARWCSTARSPPRRPGSKTGPGAVRTPPPAPRRRAARANSRHIRPLSHMAFLPRDVRATTSARLTTLRAEFHTHTHTQEPTSRQLVRCCFRRINQIRCCFSAVVLGCH